MNRSLAVHAKSKQRAFLKWAGGKYTVLDHITPRLSHASTLVEPFFGAGSVALNTDFEHYVLNDINTDLINLYKTVQLDTEHFIDACAELFQPNTNDKTFYYDVRAEFNHSTDVFRKACLFLYMNRHGYNGLCRYNSKGGFNVPFGRYVKPKFPVNEIRFFAQKFKHAVFTNVGFEQTIKQAPAGATIYCDPPYVPLTATASFTNYATSNFAQDQQERLAQAAITSINTHQTSVLISNHDTPFTRRLYQSATIHSFSVQRFISQKSKQRTAAKELLAVFQKA